MTDQSPLQRAARAIVTRNWPSLCEADVSEMWPDHIEDARAVLMAIREIDLHSEHDIYINMMMYGQAVLPEHDEPTWEDALNCWQAMIDAALEG